MIYAIALVFISLTVPGFVRAVRTLAWVDSKVTAGVKPWACNVCMTFWSTLLWAFVPTVFWGPEALLMAPPSYTIALWVLEHLEKPPERYPLIGPE